jgi:ribosomal-protein-alanine N-acetyltransferase
VNPVIRLVTLDDAAELARVTRANRSFLAPWEPHRDESFYTVEGQHAVNEDALARHAQGAAHPCVVLDEGRIVGRMTLSSIVRGPFLSCSLGYWVAEHANGRGLATQAVRAVLDVAFGELGLHRVEAGTLTHNVRSQRVLEKNGFVRFGLAPDYLRIAGRWQDHVLFQALST